MNPRDFDAIRRAVEQASEQQRTIFKTSDPLAAFAARHDEMTAAAAALRETFAADTLSSQAMKAFAADISRMYLLSEPSIKALARLGLPDNFGHLTGALHHSLLDPMLPCI